MSMQVLWSFLNDMSTLMNLSMIALNTPGVSSMIMTSLLQIVYIDILMIDKWLMPLMFEEDEDSALNTNFELAGF